MHPRTMHPRLAQVVEQLSAGTGRVSFVLDHEHRLQWVSPELRGFLGTQDDDFGIGHHIASMGFEPVWRHSVTPESRLRLAREIALLYKSLDELPPNVRATLPDDILDMYARDPCVGAPVVRTGSIDYVQPGLPPYPIDFVAASLRDEQGLLIGTMVLMYLELRPSLLSLLGRGDVAMYERMARLVQPERRAAAILFSDLQASGELSRTMSTAAYFNLISELTASFDALVAEHGGIVGKHAGDGWTAFVLAEDVGGPSAAVSGCIRIAQRMRAYAADRAKSFRLPDGLGLQVNSGVHWGPGVYLGQLVPGGRLEITALGDEVNECARIQQTARGGSLYASKQVLELLDSSDASHLGLDPVNLTYAPLASLDGASEKARRDAGTVAVAPIL
ncbi:MAG TPA: adenylate/guanylate cyclase domain-containing protein [Pseudonocardia sp.]|nr:adenylate/guanylate cyclase domain-containing protein [Pseudonocardia sp.]